MTLNFATLTTLLTFRPTWHTPHLEWSNDIKVGNMNDEVIILLYCSIIKRPDFCGVYELFNPSFLKVFLHSFNVSTCSVDLSAKLTGLRTSGKHAKPQRAESQVQGPGVTTSHRSAPATFTHDTIWASQHYYVTSQNNAVLVFVDLQRNFSTRQTVRLTSFRDRLSFESILVSEHLNCLG